MSRVELEISFGDLLRGPSSRRIWLTGLDSPPSSYTEGPSARQPVRTISAITSAGTAANLDTNIRWICPEDGSTGLARPQMGSASIPSEVQENKYVDGYKILLSDARER